MIIYIASLCYKHQLRVHTEPENRIYEYFNIIINLEDMSAHFI